MKTEDYTNLLEDMSEDEIIDLISEIRTNRQKNTISETKIKESRKKTKKTSIKSVISGMTQEEKEILKKKLQEAMQND